jgi:two-component system sensor histidine kinase QseC
MTPSIRVRLVVILLALMTVTWVFEALMTRARARAEVTAVFDAQLDQAARMLAVTVAHEAEEHDIEGFHRDLHTHEYAYPAVFQVWSADGRLLFHSPDAPNGRIPHAGNGYADITLDGEAWRVLGLELESGELVLVAHRAAARESLISEISGNVIEPLGWSLALATVLIWFGVQGGLAPLRRLAGEVAGRDAQSLLPLHTRSYPAEVHGLVEELNSMFIRLEAALQRYGRFTCDAAHELRTPLAGLRIQAQAAARAADEDSRQHALQQLMAGVDRTTRIIDQLMTLARIDPERERPGFTSVDLRTVLADVLAESLPLAKERDIEIMPPVHAGAAVVRGNPELLRILCRNLVDNAVRYTPPGGRVYLHLHHAADRVELIVEDTGPGIPAEQRTAVLERFHRLPGTGGNGSGLGLAIVERIADSHAARLTLSDRADGPGLRVSVSLPAGR